MHSKMIKMPRFITSLYQRRESTLIGHQRENAFFFTALIVFVCIPISLARYSGPSGMEFDLLNLTQLFIAALIFIGYQIRRIPLTYAINSLLLMIQLGISGEMFLSASIADEYNFLLIVSNMTLFCMTILIAVISYLKYTPCILCLIAICTYTGCILITSNENLANFWFVFAFSFAVFCFLGRKLVQNVYMMKEKYAHLQKAEERRLDFLNTNTEEVNALISLADKELNEDVEKVRLLYDMLSEKEQDYIRENITRHLLHKETEITLIKKAIPGLTPTEYDICRLILQDKKQSDICAALQKTESNVNSHRAHIRKKLNLQPEDNLKSTLQERMKQLSQTDNEDSLTQQKVVPE